VRKANLLVNVRSNPLLEVKTLLSNNGEAACSRKQGELLSVLSLYVASYKTALLVV